METQLVFLRANKQKLRLRWRQKMLVNKTIVAQSPSTSHSFTYSPSLTLTRLHQSPIMCSVYMQLFYRPWAWVWGRWRRSSDRLRLLQADTSLLLLLLLLLWTHHRHANKTEWTEKPDLTENRWAEKQPHSERDEFNLGFTDLKDGKSF